MRTTLRLFVVFLIAVAGFATAFAQDDATEIMKKSHMAYYYAGDDGIAEVTMTLVGKNGKERLREFTMLRLDIEDGGNQKYYTYFKKPSDVARTSFMVWKTSEGNDQRWIYIPAIDLIRPISADDKNSSFVGSDFSYEDVSGRHWTEDTHTMVGDSTVDGKEVWMIASTPKEGDNSFAKKVSYISKASFLPLMELYYDKKGELFRRFTALEIKDVDGFRTMTKRQIDNLEKGSHTIVAFDSIDYNAGIAEDIFTERYLKNAPRQYIK